VERYEYRQIQVAIFAKSTDPARRRLGGGAERYCEVRDSGREKPLVFGDEAGEDESEFLARVNRAYLVVINALGDQGWRVTHYTPWNIQGDFYPQTAGYFTRTLPPSGFYLLVRETD
jgi:hypothetical protein